VSGELKADLVLEGGGVKGIALLGAVLELSDAGYTFPRIAGTSAGAIVGALVAAYQQAGRNLNDLVAVMNGVDFPRFIDDGRLERATGRLGEVVAAFIHGGAHSGDYLTEWLAPELEKVGVQTFRNLAVKDPGGTLTPDQSYSLVVHTADLTRHALVRLPWDYHHYGLVADEQRVVDAVRASMSIPFYFRPVHIRTSLGTATWVDGGLVAGFPITVFDRTDSRPPRWETFGIRLSSEPTPVRDKPVRTVLGVGIESLTTMTGNWNRYQQQESGVNRRTIHVDTTGVDSVDFGISEATQQNLFENGRKAAQQFLAIQTGRA